MRKPTSAPAITLATATAAAALLLAPGRAVALDRLNWAPRNHEVLERFLTEHGRGSKDYDPARPPYAVFDWDMTSAFLDCEEQTLRFQLWNLRFKLGKDGFRALLRDEVNGVTALSPEAKGVALKDIDEDLATEYAWLYDRTDGFAGKADLEPLRASPQFQDFVAKLFFLYDGYCATPGIGADYAYVWVLDLFAGHTPDEVRALARDAIEAGLGDALRKATWRSPPGFASKAGALEIGFRTGLRIHPEIASLMESLRAAGIEVYVVTASLEELVTVFAAPGGYGYGVPADHVIGMEVEVEGGKLAPRYREGWPATYRAGKVEAIKKRLGARGDPIFGAGDSDGDVDMLSKFPGMKLSLILNRLKKGEIGKLCKRAADEIAAPAPRYILQGRNENTGLFVPSPETILFGRTDAKLID